MVKNTHPSVLVAVVFLIGSLSAADYPQAEISNGRIRATLNLSVCRKSVPGSRRRPGGTEALALKPAAKKKRRPAPRIVRRNPGHSGQRKSVWSLRRLRLQRPCQVPTSRYGCCSLTAVGYGSGCRKARIPPGRLLLARVLARLLCFAAISTHG